MTNGLMNLGEIIVIEQYQIDDTMPHFVVYGRLPTINEYISECRKNPHLGAILKRDNTNLCMLCMRDLYGLKFEKIIIHYRFFEKNRNRDKDNVFAFATKCIQDAMQEIGLIDNDGWRNIENFTHDFFIDKENPRIEVYIENVD